MTSTDRRSRSVDEHYADKSTVASQQPYSGQQEEEEANDADDEMYVETLPPPPPPSPPASTAGAESTTSKLEQLVRSVESKLTNPNQCGVCLRVLSCRSALQMHLRTHTGERPFCCKTCGRQFTTKGNLKTHMTIHRSKLPMTHVTHSCPVCCKQFSNDVIFSQHVRMHMTTSVAGHVCQEVKATNTTTPVSVCELLPSPLHSLATSSPIGLAIPPSYGRMMPYHFQLPHQSSIPLAKMLSNPLADTDSEQREIDLRVPKQQQQQQDDDQHKKFTSDTQRDHHTVGSNQQQLLPPPLEQMENIVRRTEAEDAAVTSVRRMQALLSLAAANGVHNTILASEKTTEPLVSGDNVGDRSGIMMLDSQANNVNMSVSHKTVQDSLSSSFSLVDRHVTSHVSDVITSMPSALSAFVPFSKTPSATGDIVHPSQQSFGVVEASRSSRVQATCSVCWKTFACRSALDIHYRSHTKERPYTCHICQRAFSTRGNMKQHLLTHKVTGLSPEDICLQRDEAMWNMHAQTYNGLEGEGRYHLIASPTAPLLPSNSPGLLPDANASSPATSNELPSIPEPSPPTPPSMPCTPEKTIISCEQKTGTNQVSSNHHVTASSQSPPNNTLLSASSGPGRRVAQKHTCQVCDKPFSSASALQIHVRTHTGDKPFACTVCSKAFTTKGNLKVHMGTHMWYTRPSRRGRRSSIDLDNMPGQGHAFSCSPRQDYFGAFPPRPAAGTDGRFFPYPLLPPPPPHSNLSPFDPASTAASGSIFHPRASNIPLHSLASMALLGFSRLPDYTQQVNSGRVNSTRTSPRPTQAQLSYSPSNDNTRVPVASAITMDRRSSQSPQSPATAQSSDDCDSGHYSPSTVRSGSSGELDLSMKKTRPSTPGAWIPKY